MCYSLARTGAHPESEQIVDVALTHLLAHLDEVAQLDAHSPASITRGQAGIRPTVACLAAFLEQIDDSVETERLAGRVAMGWALGLVGINDELDRRFAVALAGLLELPVVAQTFDEIRSGRENRELVAAVASVLIDRATRDPEALQRLSLLSSEDVVDQAITDALRTSQSFEFWVMGARIQLHTRPQRRRAFVATLAGLAETERQQSELRSLMALCRPQAAQEHTEVAGSYMLASRRAPAHEIKAAWQTVHGYPYSDQHTRTELAELHEALITADPHAKERSGYVAWVLTGRLDERRSAPDVTRWLQGLAYIASRPPGELPDSRYRELTEITAGLVIAELRPSEHRSYFGEAVATVGGAGWVEVCKAVIDGQRAGLEEAVAALFEIWVTVPAVDVTNRRLVFECLLPGIRITRRQREKISRLLPENLQEEWITWNETYPSTGAVARAVGRLRDR